MFESVSLFLRTDQLKENGAASIYLRFTYKRVKTDIALKVSLAPILDMKKVAIYFTFEAGFILI